MGTKTQEYLLEWTSCPAQVKNSSKSLVSSGGNLHWGFKVAFNLTNSNYMQKVSKIGTLRKKHIIVGFPHH